MGHYVPRVVLFMHFEKKQMAERNSSRYGINDTNHINQVPLKKILRKNDSFNRRQIRYQ